MPRPIRGTTYPVKGGVGIRWQHDGQRERNPGPFRNKTDAQRWFEEHVKPRLRRGGPSALITFDAFSDEYLTAWGVDVSARTVQTVTDWLKPARARFGTWPLARLEGAADDVSRWRAKLGTDDARYKSTRAMRQVLAAAIRWGYITRNPALDYGQNPAPRGDEIEPLTPAEIDAILLELADSPRDMAIITFAAETGLRTNEWVALERRDVDWRNPAVAVARRYAKGVATPYPKTGRRRVPLTPARRRRARTATRPPGHADPVPPIRRQSHRPHQLAQPRLVPRPRRRRDHPPRALQLAAHVRDQRARRRCVDPPARAADGRLGAGHRAPLRAPSPRQRNAPARAAVQT